jgi:hypothetical protein
VTSRPSDRPWKSKGKEEQKDKLIKDKTVHHNFSASLPPPLVLYLSSFLQNFPKSLLFISWSKRQAYHLVSLRSSYTDNTNDPTTTHTMNRQAIRCRTENTGGWRLNIHVLRNLWLLVVETNVHRHSSVLSKHTRCHLITYNHHYRPPNSTTGLLVGTGIPLSVLTWNIDVSHCWYLPAASEWNHCLREGKAKRHFPPPPPGYQLLMQQQNHLFVFLIWNNFDVKIWGRGGG